MKMTGRFPITIQWLALACAFGTAPSVAANGYADHPEVGRFVERVAEEHGFKQDGLRELFSRVRKQQDVLDAISRPAEKRLTWTRYRGIFLTEERIREGVEYWNENRATLLRARDEYGVPPEIITAIIGVETFYGRHTGRHPVLDSLTTLAFDYPPRGDFFRSELEQFLVLSYEELLDPLSVKGSYAGAMGRSQFISSSYRNYAVDFDGDGRRDLWSGNEDAIGSVANYFREHGWQPDRPVAVPAVVPGGGVEERADDFATAGQLRRDGIRFTDGLSDDTEARLVRLETDDGAEHWVGLRNFHVITRYNHSPLYAMAVHQLARAIRYRRVSSDND